MSWDLVKYLVSLKYRRELCGKEGTFRKVKRNILRVSGKDTCLRHRLRCSQYSPGTAGLEEGSEEEDAQIRVHVKHKIQVKREKGHPKK